VSEWRHGPTEAGVPPDVAVDPGIRQLAGADWSAPFTVRGLRRQPASIAPSQRPVVPRRRDLDGGVRDRTRY
jgi:hypothetical protein